MNQRISQPHSRASLYGFAYGLTLVFLVLTVIIHAILDLPKGYITRDLAALANVNPLLGFQSTLGALIWFTSAAICLFSSRLIVERSVHHVRFLFWAGLFTLMLGLDDLFMVHEFVLPRLGHYISLPFPFFDLEPLLTEELLFSFYLLAFACFAWVYRKIFFTFDRSWLLLALGFFALSLLIDNDLLILLFNFHEDLFLEEATKLLGIVGWGVYLYSVSHTLVQEAMADSKLEPSI